MSFITKAFSGATNDFTPQSGLPQGAQATLQSFAPSIAQANSNYDAANAGFNSLASALQAQMNGGGPNLAGAQLAQATGQNVANQAALMAGQRGASSNVGLMSRQIAQQGAGIQQQAAGQAAVNRLQQQLAAQQQLSGVLGEQGSLANQNLGIQQTGQQAQNAMITGANANQNTVGAGIAQQNAGFNQGILGGIAGTGAKMLGLAKGGEVGPQSAPMDFRQKFLQGIRANKGAMMAQGGQAPFSPHDYRQGGQVPGQPQYQGNDYRNDVVPAMLSKNEIVIPNSVTQSKDPVGNGARFIKQQLMKKAK